MGVRADDGKLLWTFDIEQTTAVIPTPIVRDDLVFFVAGYGRGGALLKQVPGAAGDIAIEVVYPLKQGTGQQAWRRRAGGRLSLRRLGGSRHSVLCAELMTGRGEMEVARRRARFGLDGRGRWSSVHPLCRRHDDAGQSLARGLRGSRPFQGSRLRRAAELVAPGRLLDGKLYVREGDVIVCYDVRKSGMIRRPPA